MPSPADDLRTLLAEEEPPLVEGAKASWWLANHGAAVLALLDAAQDKDDGKLPIRSVLRIWEGLAPAGGSYREELGRMADELDALAAAVAALTEPRP